MKSLFAAAAVIAALTGSAMAADASGNYSVSGAGARSCADYNTAPPEALAIVSVWVQGYVTALNQIVPGVTDVSGGRGDMELQQALSGVCASNPRMLLADAANVVVGGIMEKSPKAKKAKRAKAQPAPAEEAPLELRR